MMSRQIELVLTLAVLIMTIVIATPIPLKDPIASRSESDEFNGGNGIVRSEKRIGTCLRIAPNLPPCNFDSEATWRSRSGEIFHADSAAASGYPLGTLPDFLNDGSAEEILAAEPTGRKDGSPISNSGDKNLDEFHLYENDLAFTVVYYLEGCLPARLPFDLPSCPIDELQTIQMNKLVPFQLPDVQDALIFPEIDVKQIEFSHRQSRAPLPAPASQSHEDSEENKKDSIFGSENVGKVFDHSPNFLPGNENGFTFKIGDVKASGKGPQNFHKMITKSSVTPRIGTAFKKYVSKLPAASSGSATIVEDSGNPSTSLKNKEKFVPLSFGKTDEKPELYGTREVGDVLVKDKNRVQ